MKLYLKCASCFLLLSLCLEGQTVQRMRLKLSAADLPSAESILEQHRRDQGTDDEYLEGLCWLARGAALLGDWDAAARYATQTTEQAEARLSTAAAWETDRSAVYALGSAIEVEAQRLEATDDQARAIAYMKKQLQRFDDAPLDFRSRLYKRLNMLSLCGQPAPALEPEDFIGDRPPALTDLRDRPVVLFLWAYWCGDATAQVPALARVIDRYRSQGVAFLAPTRYYTDDPKSEKLKMEQTWKEHYTDLGATAVPISTSAMLRYGFSSSPTFVFIDRTGAVRQYLPTRLTEERLASEVAALLR